MPPGGEGATKQILHLDDVLNDQIVAVRISGQELNAVLNNSIKDTIIHENL